VISTEVGETLFFSQEMMEGQCGTTVQKWGHFGFAMVGAGLAGRVGQRSDIGSVSQPLEATKAWFK